MSTIISEYLDTVRNNLRLESTEEKEIMSELATHIEDEIQELKKKGFRDDEAANVCIRLLGSAKAVSHKIYEAHSQGTWRQALMASLPHILFAVIFILNWWRGIAPVLAALIAIMSTAVYGWWRGYSTWITPWLGYSLLPVIAAGLSLLYLPRGLTWLAFIVYLPLALWLIFRVVTRTMKKDWLSLTLMLLPMPAIIGWFAVTEWSKGFHSDLASDIYFYEPWIGLSFLALAIGVISFVRVRKRWLKITVLFMTGLITLSLVSSYTSGTLTMVSLLLLFLLLASIFLVPALLENGVRSGKWGKIFEHHPMS